MTTYDHIVSFYPQAVANDGVVVPDHPVTTTDDHVVITSRSRVVTDHHVLRSDRIRVWTNHSVFGIAHFRFLPTRRSENKNQMSLVIIVGNAPAHLEVLHRFDILDEVWFIRDYIRSCTRPSVPAHCKRAKCFDAPSDINISSFVAGLLAMHRASKPPGVVAMFLNWTDIERIYSFGAKIEGATELKVEEYDADPLEVSDFSESETSDSSELTD
jgi:hypothetical protein